MADEHWKTPTEQALRDGLQKLHRQYLKIRRQRDSLLREVAEGLAEIEALKEENAQMRRRLDETDETIIFIADMGGIDDERASDDPC